MYIFVGHSRAVIRLAASGTFTSHVPNADLVYFQPAERFCSQQFKLAAADTQTNQMMNDSLVQDIKSSVIHADRLWSEAEVWILFAGYRISPQQHLLLNWHVFKLTNQKLGTLNGRKFHPAHEDFFKYEVVWFLISFTLDFIKSLPSHRFIL